MKISYKTKPLSPLLKATIKAGALDAVKLQIEFIELTSKDQKT